jgi:hypothetical protein
MAAEERLIAREAKIKDLRLEMATTQNAIDSKI